MDINSLAEPTTAYQRGGADKDHGAAKVDALTSTCSHASDSNHGVANPPSLSADLAQIWLAWQCKMVAGHIRGALYLPVDAEHKGAAIATWPRSNENDPQLLDIASQALADNCGVVRSQQHYGPNKNSTCDLIACPLLVDNEPVGVVAAMISIRSEAQQHAVLQLLQWGGLWMEILVHQQSDAKREFGAFTLSLMTAIFAHADSHTAAMEVVNRLADLLDCERVSIGFRRGLSIRLQVQSHVADFDPRTQLVRSIEAAMEEAVDQATTLSQPGKSDRQWAVIHAHTKLAEQHANAAVCTIPLPGRCGAIGALTLERDASKPFDNGTLVWCESLARLIGPALELQQREEQSFFIKAVDALKTLAVDVFGPARLKLKMLMLSALTLVMALALIDGSHKVTAPASIEGAVRQLLVAPQDGYVKQAEVRAGDLVKKGQLIASLDDRNLQLEHLKWQSEKNKIQKEYQQALGKHERTKLSILRAQLDQVDAELHLVEEKIIRTQLYAPFEGVVVSGDLSQSLGAPVEIGQVLYEVAPLDSYRVILEIDEQDVAGLNMGQSGHLIIAALPRTPFPVVLDKVAPVAVSSEARNFFRVEALLDEGSFEGASLLLLPGMRGVAKVEIGQRSLLWICTHSLIDRVSLWLWSVGW
jgi:hypothetical protein